MNKSDHFHLTGVAGIGMSALAQVLMAEGYAVSGSDRYCDQVSGRETGKKKEFAEPEIADKLERGGVRFFPQDGSGITKSTRAVIISTAVECDNPDILAANRLDVPVIHRAEMLARLVEGKCCVAVTGTSGKSTVTGMIGWILEQLGADPVVVNGAALLNWRSKDRIGNARTRSHGPASSRSRSPEKDLWIIEADESDRSLLHFQPDWAVITNASVDHFELPATIEMFQTFSRQVKTGIVSTLDEPDLLGNFNPELSMCEISFTYRDAAFRVPVPGRHNADNALIAVVLCERLGFDLEKISRALFSFKGIQRRLEIVGSAHGVTVIDDYAHNPEKIRASWQAAAQHYRRVLAIWRPHGFGPLSKMMNELVNVFSELCGESDRIYVLSVYDAGGTADRSVDSCMLVEKLCERNIPAVLAEDPDELVEMITELAESGDAVLTMGARDPGLSILAQNILDGLAE